jgi:hypothetical protein
MKPRRTMCLAFSHDVENLLGRFFIHWLMLELGFSFDFIDGVCRTVASHTTQTKQHNEACATGEERSLEGRSCVDCGNPFFFFFLILAHRVWVFDLYISISMYIISNSP